MTNLSVLIIFLVFHTKSVLFNLMSAVFVCTIVRRRFIDYARRVFVLKFAGSLQFAESQVL